MLNFQGAKAGMNKNHLFDPGIIFIGKFFELTYKVKTLREDAHAFADEICRQCDAKAAQSFASETLCSIITYNDTIAIIELIIENYSKKW